MSIPPVIAEGIREAAVWAIPLLLAITMHEAAHGYAALLFGDDTAKRMGRVSANPLHHVDMMGTVILPALLIISGAKFLFGWAKPVPVNFFRLQPRRLGMVLVAAAGPATNIVLAVVSALLAFAAPYVPAVAHDWFIANLDNSIDINLVLAVFNMLPIPPLDGGRVAVGILPRPLAMQLARLENVGLFIIMGGLFLLPMVGINLFGRLIGVPVEFLRAVLLGALGL